jgi:hypothetical protein
MHEEEVGYKLGARKIEHQHSIYKLGVIDGMLMLNLPCPQFITRSSAD